jgi:hypothetical protein
MAKQTRKEFANLMEIKDNYLRALISKGKIVEEDGFIDTDNPINWAFISRIKNKNVNGKIEATVIKPQPSKKNGTTKPIPKNTVVASTIDYEKKQAEIKKIEIEIKIKNLEYAKKKKKVIPFKLYSTNINTFLHGTVGKAKNEIGKFLDHEFDNEDALRHKKALFMMIDYAINNSIENAINEMEREAEEYSLVTSW